ncbi:MAG: hypothetical protein EBZ77_03215 [Chitinophagia bacterium]|nr:hypothetical protein [Chitinophagia bacterium]
MEFNDDQALKRAMKYPLVHINRPLSLSGKQKLDGKTVLQMGASGGISVNDTFPLLINCPFKAGDYQPVFTGGGKVVFGSTAVPYVSACWFGAIADCHGGKPGSGADNTNAIQAAIVAAENVSDLYLPPTAAHLSYRITSTITVRKKLHFFSFKLHGGGTTVTHSGSDRATTIFADFEAGAAINVQGSRRVYLSDFCLIGKNEVPRRLGNYNDSLTLTNKVKDPLNFLSEGLKPTYTGITTDGEEDNKVLSADVVFDNLLIEHFYLGIGISQAGKLQGDRMRVQNCQINFCTFGISLANHQNRACHFLNVDMNRVWCGVTNCTFADKTGSMFQITGGQWCNMYKCFDIQPSYIGQCVISGLYTEAIGCIGQIGSGHVNNSSVLFTGCHFMIRDEYLKIGYAFKPPFYTLAASANVTFTSCNFWAGRDVLAMCATTPLKYFTGASISLNGCSIHHCKGVHLVGNHNVNSTFLIPVSDSIIYNRDLTVNFQENARYTTGYDAEAVTSGGESMEARSVLSPTRALVQRTIPRFYDVLASEGDIEVLETHKDTITFRYANADAILFFRSVFPGDILGTGLTSFAGNNVNNPTLTVLAIDTNNRQVSCIRHSADIDFSRMALYTTSFFTTQPVNGIAQQGSPVIAQVSAPQLLRTGDFILFDGATHAYRIAAINLSDSTIRLTQPVKEQVNGTLSIYNEQLSSYGQSTDKKELVITQGDFTATGAEKNIIVKNGSKVATVTLPAHPVTGQRITIKKGGGSGVVTVKAFGGVLSIDGQPSLQLAAPYQAVVVMFDGTGYLVMQ